MNLLRTPARLLTPARIGVTLVAVAAFALAGCSGTNANAGGEQTPNGTGQGNGQGNGQRQPGVFGTIAAISGKTLQVQGTSGQTAVTYTSKTTFTDTVAASASAVKVGLCAVARSAQTTGTPAATDQVSATEVTLTAPIGGTCQGGFGGGRGPGGGPSGAPSGGTGQGGGQGGGQRPSGAPSGAQGRFFGGATGKVVSVSGSTFVVESTRPDASGQQTTTKITVSTTGSTTWAQVKASTAKAIAVGKCALAMGKTDDTGAVSATTLRLSKPAKDGTCARF